MLVNLCLFPPTNFNVNCKKILNPPKHHLDEFQNVSDQSIHLPGTCIEKNDSVNYSLLEDFCFLSDYYQMDSEIESFILTSIQAMEDDFLPFVFE
ncbi:hypothetical protein [Candidatus Rhabdochlamydia porcellionis]|jgi:hypothetical protein|uniref:Uncharacterized protein n=1 Tax=Candidatus Rhabdochlamydia porcellionis TaxID=225148 RepID=A0ABX8Z213_9BACT|nr:hypothetical protein [Candidatus Rhabdochlamydia porcellionis]QZA59405.1 hypothetical protein RHAB15C_0001292 [Candidatus Rhabdochlamydia porcellionis]